MIWKKMRANEKLRKKTVLKRELMMNRKKRNEKMYFKKIEHKDIKLLMVNYIK